MHIDFAAILAWISRAIPWLNSLSTWLKSSLETVKTAQEIVKNSQELLKKDTKDTEEDKQVIAKVKANAELIRSYTWIGVIEYLMWFTKSAMFFTPILIGFLTYIRWIEQWFTRQSTKRSST